MSASAVMCIPLLEFQHCTAFLCLIHLASLHRLIKVYKMSVELRSVHTGEFYLIADLKTARAAHSCSIYHDRVHADDRRDSELLCQQTDKLHHDHRSD